MVVKKRTILNVIILLFICVMILIGMYWPHRYPSAWWKYIHENKAEQIELLISSREINLEERIAGYTPLLYACFRNRYKIAKLLVQAGANVNVTNGAITPLNKAAAAGDFELVRMLIEKGADPNFGIKVGIVPLDWAKNDEIARFLIEHGAKVNVPDEIDGDTPLR